MKVPLVTETFNDLREVGYHLNLFCLPCRGWESADLNSFSARGRGNASYVYAKFRCSVCGGRAEKQLQPAKISESSPRHFGLTEECPDLA